MRQPNRQIKLAGRRGERRRNCFIMIMNDLINGLYARWIRENLSTDLDIAILWSATVTRVLTAHGGEREREHCGEYR